jgi:hypothetical protein
MISIELYLSNVFFSIHVVANVVEYVQAYRQYFLTLPALKSGLEWPKMFLQYVRLKSAFFEVDC